MESRVNPTDYGLGKFPRARAREEPQQAGFFLAFEDRFQVKKHLVRLGVEMA
jgi:hypothetical protein